jgi:hypothetical protein
MTINGTGAGNNEFIASCHIDEHSSVREQMADAIDRS